jgi:hypothetical protein
MPSLIARASSTFVQLRQDFGGQDRLPQSVGGYKGISIVARPARLLHVPKISALAPARLSRDLLGLIPPPLRSGGFKNPLSFLVNRQTGERIVEIWATGKQSPFDRKLLNRSNSRNFNFGHLSLSFGSLQLV